MDDPWIAYQFDNAVTLVGSVIENASQEQVKTGPDDKPKWVAKYTMKQLLDDDFRLPRDGQAVEDTNEDEFMEGLTGMTFDVVTE